MTDLGKLHYFLGIVVTEHDRALHLSQATYDANILRRAGMSDCNPCATPVDTKAKLSAAAGAPVANPSEYMSFAVSYTYSSQHLLCRATMLPPSSRSTHQALEYHQTDIARYFSLLVTL
ncbi:hypothetical protein V2J09_000197 [Rumex salicifolius]